MAADASRSPAPSPDSYIGSLISLTSKCEIRYEGFLYNINTDESSIGLRNVRSFGTEGRKKDGPQIPANDKIYEYILFRGSDIKDLQVKSTPHVQTSSIHNDPAIIQSQYSLPTSTPASISMPSTMPTAANVAVPDPNSHTPPLGMQRPTFQGSLPLLYQSGPTMPPMYYQGFYPPPNILPQMPQSSLLRASSLQYPILNPSPLFPPVATTQSLTSTIIPPVQPSSLLAPESASSPMPSVSLTSLPVTTIGANLPLPPPLTANRDPLIESSNSMPSTLSSKPLTISTGSSLKPAESSGSSLKPAESAVPLVTPDGLLQPGPSTVPITSQPLQMGNKDVLESTNKDLEVKPQETTKKPSAPVPPVPESTTRMPEKLKEPILPLPKPFHQKPNGSAMHTHHYNRGRGRGRGRGNGYSRPVTKFTEDFDFTAMNEKFNKDEVWGHLGKSIREGGEDDFEADNIEDDADAEIHKPEFKPVYVKDDFFDTLSCNTLDRDSRGGRTKFSEQRKLDTETFGDFPRHYANRGGGRGGFRGGPRGRGSYNGRGYGYVARGQGHGHGMSNRAS